MPEILQWTRSGAGFRVQCAQGEFWAGALVVATGGLSIPKMGATGLAYELARQFGLSVIAPRPALVPLLLGGEEARWTELTGVSTDVIAWADAVRFPEKLLVTHRGLSGPAVLQASSYWSPGGELLVDLVPAMKALQPLFAQGARRDAAGLKQALRAVLPQRLAAFICGARSAAELVECGSRRS